MAAAVVFLPAVNGKKTVTFPSKDGLLLTADVYQTDPNNPWILLCHQAGYSRGEYKEIAPLLGKSGFNCVAIDQRSGKAVNEVRNITASTAKREGLPTEYADAEPDIEQAIVYTAKMARGKPIVLWGSSYSAALALKLGKTNEHVRAIVAFSPGEYIKGEDIAQAAAETVKPVFVTSSRSEAKDVTELIKGIDAQYRTQFVPEKEGQHGSKALWASNENHSEYWDTLRLWLGSLEKQ